MRGVFIILMVLLLGSCSREDCPGGPGAGPPLDLTIQRQELNLFDLKEPEEVEAFLEANPAIRDHFFFADQYPDTRVLATRLLSVINDEYVDTLYAESTAAFEQNADRFEEQLEMAFGNLKGYYPNIEPPIVQTMVSGLYNDLYISDSVMIIGLDYFIGEEATYRPNDIPGYILERYNYDYLVPSIMKFVVQDIPAYGEENTLLSEMIDFGKIYYLISRIMPCTSDHEIIGFTSRQMEDVKANQEIIWASLIQNESLYETSEFIKSKFLGERPNVYEIGEKCPGRIGAWVGWEIVRSYVERNDITMSELMGESNHHEIFSKSGYKPQNI